MLPDRQSQLLTAYVDGELGTRDRHAVEKLLSSSQEARVLLESLEKDAKRLRELGVQQFSLAWSDISEGNLSHVATGLGDPATGKRM